MYVSNGMRFNNNHYQSAINTGNRNQCRNKPGMQRLKHIADGAGRKLGKRSGLDMV
jgi:hypothetical protein